MKRFIHGAFSFLAVFGAFHYGMLLSNNTAIGWSFAACGLIISLLDLHFRNLP